MYKSEAPLYGDLVNIVWEADATVVRKKQEAGGNRQHNDIDPDEILPSRNRVERHGAIRLGTAYELAVIKRMFAIMGMFPVGYYDFSIVGFPMHATAFRPQGKEALDENPFRMFTTLLRMDLLTKTRDMVAIVLRQRKIFTLAKVAISMIRLCNKSAQKQQRRKQLRLNTRKTLTNNFQKFPDNLTQLHSEKPVDLYFSLEKSVTSSDKQNEFKLSYVAI